MSASNSVSAETVYYIKLGQRGAYEDLCFRDGTLRLNYQQLDDRLAREGSKSDIAAFFLKHGLAKAKSAASNHATIIDLFFRGDPDALWITFSNGLLYWCFAETTVKYLGVENPDELGCFVRDTRNGWRSTDLKGRPLHIAELSGELTKVSAFQMTICTIKNEQLVQYLLAKIRGIELPEIRKAKELKDAMLVETAALIKKLPWRDFELLVDLIFSRSGWRRVSSVGGTKKTVDLDLVLPTTGGRAFVQIKSQTRQAELDEYARDFGDYGSIDLTSASPHQFFFIYHTARSDLKSASPNIVLWGPSEVATATFDSGLIDWLLQKVQ